MRQVLRAASGLLLLLPFVVTGGDLLSDLLLPQHWLQLGLVILCVVWLLRSLVRTPDLQRTSSVVLLSANLVLLTVAFARDSEWFARVAFCVSAAVAAGAMPQRPRFKVLAVLLTVFAGLPPFLSLPLNTFISERLLNHISTIASLLGLWNFHSEAILTTQQGPVNLNSILNTPFGFSGLSVVLAVWLTYRRRTTVQMLLALPFALPVAALHLGCSGLLAVLARGWSLPIVPVWCWPILLLLPSLLLLLSAEQLSLFLTSAIIPLDRRVNGAIVRNHFNRLWDQMVSGRSSDMVGEIRLLAPDRRRLSSDAVFTEFVRDWWFSRRLWHLPSAAVAILTAVTPPLLNLEMAARAASVFARYEQQLTLAIEQQNPDQQELLLRGMAAQMPDDLRRRLQLASFLWTQRSQEAGWTEYERVASMDAIGAAEAHLWIARNAMSTQPFRSLTDQQLIQHLQQALQADQKNGEAHALLAGLYLRAGEMTIGESHLRQAADAELKYVDDLLAYCRNRRRPFPSQSQIQLRLQQLTQQLASQPDDDALRVRLSSMLVIVNQIDKAEQLLSEGLQRHDSTELRQTMAELRLFQVRLSLLSPLMVGDESLLRVREALRLDPTSEEAAVLAAVLHLEGADFTEHAAAALQHWQAEVQRSGAAAALRSLAMLQFACGQPAEALELFTKLPQKRSEDAFIVIAALRQTGRNADALAEAQSAAAPQLAAGTVRGRTVAADLYCQAAAFAEARQCLEAPAATAAEQQLLSTARGSTALEELDAITGYPGHFRTLEKVWTPVVSDTSVQQVQQLIQTSLQSPEVSLRVVDRLYLLTVQGGALGTAAEDALTVYRAQGGDAEGILVAIGSRALQPEQFDTALHWLQQARNSSADPGPSLLNNLAVAIVRAQQKERYAEALALANSAVQALPGNHFALATRAEVHLALNNATAAQQDLEAALQLRPDYAETLQLLARTADLQGNTQQAEDFRQQAATLIGQ